MPSGMMRVRAPLRHVDQLDSLQCLQHYRNSLETNKLIGVCRAAPIRGRSRSAQLSVHLELELFLLPLRLNSLRRNVGRLQRCWTRLDARTKDSCRFDVRTLTGFPGPSNRPTQEVRGPCRGRYPSIDGQEDRLVSGTPPFPRNHWFSLPALRSRQRAIASSANDACARRLHGIGDECRPPLEASAR